MTAGDCVSAVAVGGGTGLPRVLTALLSLGLEPTAVVTMADDGGSSGRLREELGILPPGDVRNCLVALAGDAVVSDVFQYRFPGDGALAGHALGNLVISALADITGDFVEAVRTAGEWLDIRGRVLPSTLEDVRLIAVDRDGRPIEGQATIANNPVPIASVRLDPEAPAAYPEAVEAIESADLVVIGPGSLFTSIVPNLLVDGVADALRRCPGTRAYLCNVANQRGETQGMDAAEHVEALFAHGARDAVDVVFVDESSRAEPSGEEPKPDRVDGSAGALRRIEELGARVVTGRFAERDDARHHDPSAIARALEGVL
jgi:uncharacterized cofD-like protein